MTDIKQSILLEHQSVGRLEKELQSAHRMLDSLNLREQIVQESNDNLLAQVKTLKNELDAKTKQIEEEGLFSSMGQGDTCQIELKRAKQELTKIDVENKRLNALCQTLEKELEATEYNVRDLEADLAAQSNQLVKEIKTKEKLEEQLKVNNDEMEKIKSDLGATKNHLKKSEDNLEKINETLKELKVTNSVLNSKNISYDKQIKKLNRELKIKTELRAANGEEIDRLQEKINCQESELLKVQSEMTRLVATHESSLRKRRETVREIESVSRSKKALENDITSLEKNSVAQQEENNKLKNALQVTRREKKLLEKNSVKLNEQLTACVEKLNLKETTLRALEVENNDSQKTIDSLEQRITSLVKNKEKLDQEIVVLKQNIHEHCVQCNRKDLEVRELKKELNSKCLKLKDQEHELYTLKTEKNLNFKNLTEAKDEAEEMKEKLKMAAQQLEQQKEYVAYKEIQLTKNDTTLKQTEKELQKCQQEIDEFENKIQEMTTTLIKKNDNEKSTCTTLRALQMKVEKLHKQNNQANADKSKLINQINIRNEELMKQKDANDVLRTTLGRGEAEYHKRIDDIRLLKIEVKRLSTQKRLLVKNISSVQDLRREVLKYEQKLNKERMKCRALEETLMKPTNVHPWRLLKNTDPPAYEMTVKVRILQKRLLEQCTKMFDKDLQVREIQARYENLKKEFVKLPGMDTFKEMNHIKRTLMNNDDKVKNLSGALIASEQTTAEYRFVMEQTKKELDEFKNKYYDLKRVLTKMKMKKQKISTSAKSDPDRTRLDYNRFLDMAI
ncbi:cilia- and flagella-associated protein 58-like [Adelges cooleyi]|uniref:cilia- and flagella-associated protein 58-like n=1 Tax=Adelges cooleyi TaxID=133065 RepID=UPI00217F477C|nr:cilia- and flagella-associated protein 58-like [Adelges cooleyi]